MRLLEVEIEIYDKSEAVVVGSDGVELKRSRCLIDLDEVCSCWIDINDSILICMKSGETYGTKSYTLDQFRELWEGHCGVPCQKVDKAVSGKQSYVNTVQFEKMRHVGFPNGRIDN